MITIAIVIAGAIVQARLWAGPDPANPILFALALPVSLLALELRLAGAVIGAAAAMLTIWVWAQGAEPALGLLDYVAHAAVIVGSGVLAALLADRAREADELRREALHEVIRRREEEEQLRREMTRLVAVAEAAKEMIQGSGARESRLAICHATRSVVGAPIVALYEPAPGGRELRATASSGVELEGTTVPLDFNAPGRPALMGVVAAYATGHPVSRYGYLAPAGAIAPRLEAAGVRSVHWQPIGERDRVIGVIEIAWTDPAEELSSEMRDLLDLVADEAEIALERAQGIAEIESMAVTDELTGLGNRRAWEDQLERDLARAGRDHSPICVALLDLDAFKAYNDEHGHQAGDRLLRSTVAAWREKMRSGDFLARWGGDEFALIMPSCTPAAGIGAIERLREATPDCPFSAGIAGWNREETAEALVRRADNELYRAKAAGGGRTAVGAAIEVPGLTEGGVL